MAIVLVTGANRGIGREVSRRMAAEGHTVVATARGDAKARTVSEELGAVGAVRSLRLDVTDPADIAAAASWVDEEFSRLDVLINNAAISYDTWQRATTADLDVVRDAMETNVYGPWEITKEFLPLLRRGRHPRVVNVSSESGSLARMGDGTPGYAMTKAALNSLTRMFADAVRGDGILVNSVCPGWVATDMGGPNGGEVSSGAASVIWAATLDDDGPTGGFFRHGEPLEW